MDILILLVFLCILGFGVESTYKKMHIISGKHAQELYVDFYMLPKASECGEADGKKLGEDEKRDRGGGRQQGGEEVGTEVLENQYWRLN